MDIILSKFTVVITYIPLSDEVDFNEFINFDKHEILRISQDKNTNPFLLSKKLISDYRHKKVAILVPGQQFDIFGNRKGRGGGWYDRFLSSIPNKWFKIGITSDSSFLLTKLNVNNWDESVDLVISYNKDKKLHKIHAKKY